MAVDKNWAIVLYFDVVPLNSVWSSDLEAVVRGALSSEWAVWGRPTGVVSHESPHVAAMGYVRLTADPIQVLSEMVERVELALIREYNGTSPLLFAGTDISLRPAVDIHWAPGVRGSAA